ncbi:hypothetical protein ACFLU6_14355 [Acidobacteriota bacterium]
MPRTWIALACVVVSASLYARPARAAPGDVLRDFELPVYLGGYSVAVDCDGNIYCTISHGSTGLYKLDDFGNVLSITPMSDTANSGPIRMHGMAWDKTRQILWAEWPEHCYADVYRLDPRSGEATFAFEAREGRSCSTENPGITYDPATDTIWVKEQNSQDVGHYTVTGTPLPMITLKDETGGDFRYGHGIVVGTGNRFYVANAEDYNDQRIQTHSRTTGEFIAVFASLPSGYHTSSFGMECDPVNFAPLTVLWVRQTGREQGGPNHLVAVEALPGDCSCGDCPTDLPVAMGVGGDLCGPGMVTLDGSGSIDCGGGGLEYRWVAEGTIVCDWTPSATCDVSLTASTVFTLDVRCSGSRWCRASDTVAVTVDPDITPPDLGNTLRAVRGGTELEISWASVSEARTYTLHRSEAKGVWPSPPFLQGIIPTSVILPDIPHPPDLYFYRAAGASCSGKQGP